MGLRELPEGSRVLDGDAETLHLRTRDPHAALSALHAQDRQHVFLEGGPRLAAAFLEAGLVDEVIAYVAPMFLGGGTHAVEGLAITTIADARRLEVLDVAVVGIGPDRNVRLTLGPGPRTAPDETPAPTVEDD
jgi:diaminohydroxyphosphoribosylaminopyrimidine deaminase/5-amino-6-(5-phosphoribosylamino)uracil reductase